MNKAFPKYRREVLQRFKDVKKDERYASAIAYKNHAEKCEELLLSQHYYSFILPTNAEIVKHTTPANIKFEDLNLPFDNCVLEYQISADYYKEKSKDPKYEHPDATVLIVSKDEHSIALLPIWHMKNKHTNTSVWLPAMYGIALTPESYIKVHGDTGRVEIKNPYIVIASREVKARIDAIPPETIIEEVSDELRAVAHFAMLCGCDNVNAKKIHKADTKLVKKAAKHGGIPHNDYWVLDVYMNDDHESSGSGEGGSHSSPRFHVRRGHIRRYQTGKTTWVRQCVVGTPELGVINKDYRVVA